MNKLDQLKEMLNFLPELFPPDLAAITLSNCTHFIGVWNRDDEVGRKLRIGLYPDKPLDDKVMLGQVILQKKKITKYYTLEESVSDIPYLAVGVPIYEGDTLVGAICVIREEAILEAQNRCKALMQVHEIVAESMENVSDRLEYLINSYTETRKIADLMRGVNHKASLLQVNTLLHAARSNDGAANNNVALADEIKGMANETEQAALQIINLLNEFDTQAAAFFSVIRNMQIIVNNMNKSITDINEYLIQQSNLIVND